MDQTSSTRIETENEELKKRLQQTEKELEQYKSQLQKMSQFKSLSKGPLDALTGSFKTTSLYSNKKPTDENISELARKASAIFSSDPSAKELKTILRQLLVQGDPTAKRLAGGVTKADPTELIAYLKAKSLGLGSELPQRKTSVTEKDLARAQELAELRAEGGIPLSNPTKPLLPGFSNATISAEASGTAQQRAIERFASKRERPQSYGYYYKPPVMNKSKVVLNKPTNGAPGQNVTSPIGNGTGLLNLNDLANSSPSLGMNGFQQKSPTFNLSPRGPTAFNLMNPLTNPLMQQPFGTFPIQNSTVPPPNGFGGFEMPTFNGLGAGFMPQMGYNLHQQQNVNGMFPQNNVVLKSDLKPKPVQKVLKSRTSDSSQSVDSPKRPPRRWTEEEDELLRKSVEKHGARNWKKIATDVPNRNHVQCLQRWRKALDPKVVKGHWSPEEDMRLLELVTLNPKNWGHVARGIEGRTAKQCRERYHNHLDPNIKKGNWSFEEDKIIVLVQKQLGNKWADIAKRLDGRTENSVKIRWKSIKRQVTALKEEQTTTQNINARKVKRNTMDRARLEKLLEVWDFSTES